MQKKSVILMLCILFYSFSSIHAENSTSIFNNKDGAYGEAVSNVVIGVLEDDREELANWKEGPSQNRVTRSLFEKKGEDWVLSTFHPNKMPWTIAYNGENVGHIESLPRSTGQNTGLDRDIHTPETGSEQKLVLDEPTDMYSGWLNTMQHPPLAVVSEANVSDPDKWQPFQSDDIQMEYIRSVFRGEYPLVTNCDADEIPVEDPWEYGDDDIILENPIRSKNGDILVSMHLEGCKCGMSYGPFLPQLFLLRADNTFNHLEITSTLPHNIDNLSLFFIDAGDYDGNGESEVLFFVSGYNEDGYALFYDSFRKKVLYTWGYN